MSSIFSISQNELNELSRKFKYYHSAVRPAAPDNFVSDRNGTFFNIPVEIHLLATRIVNVSFSTFWKTIFFEIFFFKWGPQVPQVLEIFPILYGFYRKFYELHFCSWSFFTQTPLRRVTPIQSSKILYFWLQSAVTPQTTSIHKNYKLQKYAKFNSQHFSILKFSKISILHRENLIIASGEERRRETRALSLLCVSSHLQTSVTPRGGEISKNGQLQKCRA